jgi:hypothetical protein
MEKIQSGMTPEIQADLKDMPYSQLMASTARIFDVEERYISYDDLTSVLGGGTYKVPAFDYTTIGWTPNPDGTWNTPENITVGEPWQAPEPVAEQFKAQEFDYTTLGYTYSADEDIWLPPTPTTQAEWIAGQPQLRQARLQQQEAAPDLGTTLSELSFDTVSPPLEPEPYSVMTMASHEPPPQLPSSGPSSPGTWRPLDPSEYPEVQNILEQSVGNIPAPSSVTPTSRDALDKLRRRKGYAPLT